MKETIEEKDKDGNVINKKIIETKPNGEKIETIEKGDEKIIKEISPNNEIINETKVIKTEDNKEIIEGKEEPIEKLIEKEELPNIIKDINGNAKIVTQKDPNGNQTKYVIMNKNNKS